MEPNTRRSTVGLFARTPGDVMGSISARINTKITSNQTARIFSGKKKPASELVGHLKPGKNRKPRNSFTSSHSSARLLCVSCAFGVWGKGKGSPKHRVLGFAGLCMLLVLFFLASPPMHPMPAPVRVFGLTHSTSNSSASSPKLRCFSASKSESLAALLRVSLRSHLSVPR